MIAKPRVGILVGHYGMHTGASHKTRDEWILAYKDALRLVQMLEKDGRLHPVFIHIDRTQHPWDLAIKVKRSLLGRFGNIDVRYEWAMREEVDVAIEFHINSAKGSPAGHEVFICRFPGPKTRRLGQLLINEFDERLGNARRGLKQKSFRILRKLHGSNVPAAIIEPAFIQEDAVESKQWRSLYVYAVREALYHFFNV